MKENLRVATLHLDAALAALERLAAELDEWEAHAHPDDHEAVSTACDVVGEATDGLEAVRDGIGDIEGFIEEVEE